MERFLTTLRAILFLIAALSCVLFVVVEPYIPRSLRQKGTDQHPYYFENDAQYWTAITEYAICDDFLYVLFDEKNVLKCYDLSGNYSHSYHFSDPQNGGAYLVLAENSLYVTTKQNNMLQFENGKFKRFLDSDSDSFRISQLKRIQVPESVMHSSSGSYYTMKGASIWKTNAIGQQICVVHRPQFFIIFQKTSPFSYIGLLSIFGAVILSLILEKRPKHS